MSKAHGQRPWGSVLRSWPISTVTESAQSAPHHPALEPFCRKERFGREYLWVNGLPGGESQTGQ